MLLLVAVCHELKPRETLRVSNTTLAPPPSRHTFARCTRARSQGIGDHAHSWALDGYRCRKWNGEYGSEDYGLAPPSLGGGGGGDASATSQNGLRRWCVGDVVGCSVDMDTLSMRFSINGESLGKHGGSRTRIAALFCYSATPRMPTLRPPWLTTATRLATNAMSPPR